VFCSSIKTRENGNSVEAEKWLVLGLVVGEFSWCYPVLVDVKVLWRRKAESAAGRSPTPHFPNAFTEQTHSGTFRSPWNRGRSISVFSLYKWELEKLRFQIQWHWAQEEFVVQKSYLFLRYLGFSSPTFPLSSRVKTYLEWIIQPCGFNEGLKDRGRSWQSWPRVSVFPYLWKPLSLSDFGFFIWKRSW
jgi:hypothetical protein